MKIKKRKNAESIKFLINLKHQSMMQNVLQNVERGIKYQTLNVRYQINHKSKSRK